jgi:predicted PurR-regulated permease PerM
MQRDLVIRLSLKNVVAIGALVLLVLLLGSLIHLLTTFFLAVLLAVGISGPVNWLEDHRVPRGLSIGLIYLVMIAALTALGFVLVPMVIDQIQLLFEQFPNLIREPLRQFSEWLGERFPSLRENLPTGDLASQVASEGVALISGFGGFALNLGLRIGSLLIALIVIMTMAFFLTSQRRLATRAVLLFAPVDSHDELDRVLGVIGRRLGRGLWAQALIAGFYAASFGAGLALLKVPYAVTLAIMGGVLELVPYVGGFVATLLTMIVAFTVDPILAVWVLILHIIIGNIEVHVLAPRLMGRAVETHPIIAILGLFAGAELLGITGAVIAIPLVVVVQAIVEEFYLRPQGRLGLMQAPGGRPGPAPGPVAAEAGEQPSPLARRMRRVGFSAKRRGPGGRRKPLESYREP